MKRTFQPSRRRRRRTRLPGAHGHENSRLVLKRRRAGPQAAPNLGLAARRPASPVDDSLMFGEPAGCRQAEFQHAFGVGTGPGDTSRSSLPRIRCSARPRGQSKGRQWAGNRAKRLMREVFGRTSRARHRCRRSPGGSSRPTTRRCGWCGICRPTPGRNGRAGLAQRLTGAAHALQNVVVTVVYGSTVCCARTTPAGGDGPRHRQRVWLGARGATRGISGLDPVPTPAREFRRAGCSEWKARSHRRRPVFLV